MQVRKLRESIVTSTDTTFSGVGFQQTLYCSLEKRPEAYFYNSYFKCCDGIICGIGNEMLAHVQIRGTFTAHDPSSYSYEKLCTSDYFMYNLIMILQLLHAIIVMQMLLIVIVLFVIS